MGAIAASNSGSPTHAPLVLPSAPPAPPQRPLPHPAAAAAAPPIPRSGLPAGARVFYRVGWPAYNDWSAVHNFTTFNADDSNFPFTVGVMADLGLSFNSSLTVRQMFNANPKVVLNIGDLPYAGDEAGPPAGLALFASGPHAAGGPNLTAGVPLLAGRPQDGMRARPPQAPARPHSSHRRATHTSFAPTPSDNFLPDGREGTLKGLKYLLSYQPRWDMYGRMLQRLSARVPIMTSTGNHEIEFQPDGTGVRPRVAWVASMGRGAYWGGVGGVGGAGRRIGWLLLNAVVCGDERTSATCLPHPPRSPAQCLLPTMQGALRGAAHWQLIGQAGRQALQARGAAGSARQESLACTPNRSITSACPLPSTPPTHSPARYPVPQDPSKPPQAHLNRFSNSNPSPDRGLYYSWSVPGTAHLVALTSYITNDTFSPSTAQWR